MKKVGKCNSADNHRRGTIRLWGRWDESSNLPGEPEFQEKQQFVHCTDTSLDLP